MRLKRLVFVGITLGAALLAYICFTGIYSRDTFWVAASNLTHLIEARKELGEGRVRDTIDVSIDENLTWLQKYDSYVRSIEFDPLRASFKDLLREWVARPPYVGQSWQAITSQPEWIAMRRRNMEYLQFHAAK